MNEKLPGKKVVLAETKVALWWRVGFYCLSAFSCASTMLDISRGDFIEALGNIGLTLVFIGMMFRFKEAAVLAYVSNEKERVEQLAKFRAVEKAQRPWVSLLMKCGWIMMLFGILGVFLGE